MFVTSICAGLTVETWAAGLGVAWLGCDWWEERKRERERERLMTHVQWQLQPETIIVSRFTRINIHRNRSLWKSFHATRLFWMEEKCAGSRGTPELFFSSCYVTCRHTDIIYFKEFELWPAWTSPSRTHTDSSTSLNLVVSSECVAHVQSLSLSIIRSIFVPYY